MAKHEPEREGRERKDTQEKVKIDPGVVRRNCIKAGTRRWQKMGVEENLVLIKKLEQQIQNTPEQDGKQRPWAREGLERWLVVQSRHLLLEDERKRRAGLKTNQEEAREAREQVEDGYKLGQIIKKLGYKMADLHWKEDPGTWELLTDWATPITIAFLKGMGDPGFFTQVAKGEASLAMMERVEADTKERFLTDGGWWLQSAEGFCIWPRKEEIRGNSKKVELSVMVPEAEGNKPERGMRL